MTTKGSCACGEVEIEFSGEPAIRALCHCTDCQKWSGAAFTSNAVVPRTSLRVTKGTPRTWDAVGDSGKTIKRFFCGTCGSGLYAELDLMPDVTCVKGGCLDGGAAALGGAVGVEFYTKDRVSYLRACEGAQQETAFGA